MAVDKKRFRPFASFGAKVLSVLPLLIGLGIAVLLSCVPRAYSRGLQHPASVEKFVPPRETAQQRNPESRNLDELSLSEIIPGESYPLHHQADRENLSTAMSTYQQSPFERLGNARSEMSDHLWSDGRKQVMISHEADGDKVLREIDPYHQPAPLTGPSLWDRMEDALEKFKGRGEEGEEFDIRDQMDHKEIEVYKAVGQLLTDYTSGNLPKAFKAIPWLDNWDEVLALTRPLSWTPHATLEATKLFLAPKQQKDDVAQQFLNTVLLPHVTQNLVVRNKRKVTGKLKQHYYWALQKAMRRPDAFTKGILLPIAKTAVTTREAEIIASVVAKTSFPLISASAAVMKIAQIRPYRDIQSVLMCGIIKKKYKFAPVVLECLVDHFLSFVEDREELTLRWHKCLFEFILTYKDVLTNAQREQLLLLLKVHYHHGIGPECRKQLLAVIAKTATNVTSRMSTLVLAKLKRQKIARAPAQVGPGRLIWAPGMPKIDYRQEYKMLEHKKVPQDNSASSYAGLLNRLSAAKSAAKQGDEASDSEEDAQQGMKSDSEVEMSEAEEEEEEEADEEDEEEGGSEKLRKRSTGKSLS